MYEYMLYGITSVAVSCTMVFFCGLYTGLVVVLFYFLLFVILNLPSSNEVSWLRSESCSLLGLSLDHAQDLLLVLIGVVALLQLFGTRVSSDRRKRKNHLEDPASRATLVSWCSFPDVLFSEVVSRMSCSDIRAMRLVCSDWLLSTNRAVKALRPTTFNVESLVTEFPFLTSVDLSACSQDITPIKLRALRGQRYLSELVIGRNQRLIACTVTDRALAELVPLTNLRTLNLSQCVHIGDAGIMALVHVPSLTNLDISGCVGITDVGIMLLAQLSELISLEMPWCLKVTNAGLKALSSLRKLAHLNISGCQLVSEAGIVSLSALSNLESLNLLNLGYSKPCVTDSALAALKVLSKLKSLSVGGVQVTSNKLTDTGFQLVTEFFPKTTQLTIISLGITDEGVQHITKLTNLQSLSLRGCSRVSPAIMLYLSQLTSLTELVLLHNVKLQHKSGEMAVLSRLSNIQVLGVGSSSTINALGDAEVNEIAGLAQNLRSINFPSYAGTLSGNFFSQCSKLTMLDLQGALNVDDDSLVLVAKLSLLTSLQLNRCTKLTDKGIMHLQPLTQLQVLNLSHCFNLTDKSLEVVGSVTSLNQLYMQQCLNVTDNGLTHLSNLVQLRLLDVSYCEKLTGAGFEVCQGHRHFATLNVSCCSQLCDTGLSSIGRLSSLTKLDICHCPLVSDTGLAHLSGLTILTALDMAHCPRVGDVALAILSNLPALTTIKLNGCLKLSDAGVAQLTKLNGLLTVHLDKCIRLTDTGLAHLAQVTGLTSLRLARCPEITDVGVGLLSSLTRLSTLSLANCPNITDLGLLALSPLTTLASLEY